MLPWWFRTWCWGNSLWYIDVGERVYMYYRCWETAYESWSIYMYHKLFPQHLYTINCFPTFIFYYHILPFLCGLEPQHCHYPSQLVLFGGIYRTLLKPSVVICFPGDHDMLAAISSGVTRPLHACKGLVSWLQSRPRSRQLS